jgi:long-chain acyl-CoA synthetase
MEGAVRTLGELIRSQAATRPSAIALIDGRSTTTYGALFRHACQIARGLSASGVVPGDRVIYVGKNSRAYFELLFGVALTGAVIVPVSWRLSAAEIADILADAGGSVVFVEDEFRSLLPQTERVVVEITVLDGGRSLAEWYAQFPASESTLPIKESDVVLQLYTSGTTGRAKGVMLTHRNLLAQREFHRRLQVEWDTWSDADVSLVSMPIAHISGSGWSLYAFYNGARNVIVRDFEPGYVLECIERYRVSRMFVVPAALRMLIQDGSVATRDVRSVKFVAYGGSPITEGLLGEVTNVFNCGFIQLYGLTESSGAASALTPSDHIRASAQQLRSAGRALPGVEIAILDGEGRQLGVHGVGEIAIRGSGVMAGYWKQSAATSAAVNAEGWLRTGDVGEFDSKGYLYVRDRLKDMIISGGENVYAAEVESVLSGHAHIADAAVIGVPDDKWGEIVKAVVVLRPGCSLEKEELQTWLRARLAGYKVPKQIEFVAELPRNSTGKVLKRLLRDGVARSSNSSPRSG